MLKILAAGEGKKISNMVEELLTTSRKLKFQRSIGSV